MGQRCAPHALHPTFGALLKRVRVRVRGYVAYLFPKQVAGQFRGRVGPWKTTKDGA